MTKKCHGDHDEHGGNGQRFLVLGREGRDEVSSSGVRRAAAAPLRRYSKERHRCFTASASGNCRHADGDCSSVGAAHDPFEIRDFQ